MLEMACDLLWDTATHCITPQNTTTLGVEAQCSTWHATYCNTLQHTARRCKILYHSESSHTNAMMFDISRNLVQHTTIIQPYMIAIHSIHQEQNTLCNKLQHTLQQTATHSATYSATHCNTLHVKEDICFSHTHTDGKGSSHTNLIRQELNSPTFTHRLPHAILPPTPNLITQ